MLCYGISGVWSGSALFAYVQGDDFFFFLFFFFFFYFSKKMGSDISCKMSPGETDCVKCQIPFSVTCKKIFQKVSYWIYHPTCLAWIIWVWSGSALFASVQIEDVFFFYFSQKIGSDISCKLSPDETVCMKCLIPFSEERKHFQMSSATILKGLLLCPVFNNWHAAPGVGFSMRTATV